MISFTSLVMPGQVVLPRFWRTLGSVRGVQKCVDYIHVIKHDKITINQYKSLKHRLDNIYIYRHARNLIFPFQMQIKLVSFVFIWWSRFHRYWSPCNYLCQKANRYNSNFQFEQPPLRFSQMFFLFFV